MNFFNQSLFASYVLKNNFNFLDIGCSGTKDSVCFPLLDNGCDSIPGVKDDHLNSEGCKMVADSITRKLKSYE